MKVCTAHDAHSLEVRGAEALLGIFFVSHFSAFLSKAPLGLFWKHFFFRISLSLIRVRKAQKCRNPQKCGRLEALKKKSANAEKSAKSPSLYSLVFSCYRCIYFVFHTCNTSLLELYLSGYASYRSSKKCLIKKPTNITRPIVIKGNIKREINCSRPNPKSGILFVLSFISIYSLDLHQTNA